MPNAAERRLYVPDSAHVARSLLSELKNAHRDLINQMAAMDALTAKDQFDAALCVNSRWRLSQASLVRRLLTARICDFFLPRVELDDRAGLRQLLEADRALLAKSSAHLGRWSVETVRRDWAGFCTASRAIRRKTHVHVAHEQRVLYPMLEEAADRL